MVKKSQSFLALFVVAMSLFFFGVYLYNSWVEINHEQSSYDRESQIIYSLKSLKPGSCVEINYYLSLSSFNQQDKGVIVVGPLDYSIKGVVLHEISDFWPQELVSYKKTNSTYTFGFIKNNRAYLEVVYPFNIRPKSKKGYIKSVCVDENGNLVIY